MYKTKKNRKNGITVTCRRSGCCFSHKCSPRRHGFCCNACRTGDKVHTRNCTGHSQPVIVESPLSARRRVTRRRPLHPLKAPRRHELTRRAVNHNRGFLIPSHWARKTDLWDCLDWYMNRLRLRCSGTVTQSWKLLDEKMDSIHHERELSIYVLAENSASSLLADPRAFINVHARGLDVHAPHLFNMCEVTGVDFDVQAVLVCQHLTAVILHEACRNIEWHGLNSFAFVCHGATHRSCGCAILLAILVYPKARIVFSTHRTKRAARQAGMITREDE